MKERQHAVEADEVGLDDGENDLEFRQMISW
jgi:hypothetical protein